MDNLQVEVSEIKQPLGLTAVKVLGLMEVYQLLMVSEDLYGESGAMEVMSPGLQGMDDGKEFPVIDAIIVFD